ncbi:hypothetical protein [Mycobacterium neglectum]|uniref:hypothetical protein n=1 Tax=Mycobacterium neglectum TaxID=242737 RepID=UPI0011457B6F|nr:hypothetical protein [Mycobacterium neglectum]
MIQDSSAAGSTMLAAFAEFLGDDDDELVNQIRAELTARRPLTPRWLAQLGQTRIHRGVRGSHVLDPNDLLLLQFRVPTVGEFTCAVDLDLHIGDFIRRVEFFRGPLETVLNIIDEPATDMRCDEVDLADIRARLKAAIEFEVLFSPRQASGWPEYGALVEWLIRDLPAGGSALPRSEWSTQDAAALIARFSASVGGAAFGRRQAELLESLVEFGMEDGAGDPLRWNERRAERWLFDHLLEDTDYCFLDRVEAAPYLLRAFIRFAHDEVGIRSDLTDEVLEMVDAWDDKYFNKLRHKLADDDDADWFGRAV